MKKVIYYKNLQVKPDERLIMTRLGYRSGTAADEGLRQKIAGDIARAVALCRVKGAFLRAPVRVEDGRVVIMDEYELPGRSLAGFLAGCHECVLMASTAGREITRRIEAEMAQGNASRAVVMDATASEMADGGLDVIMKIQNGLLIKEGRRLTKRRYSPGYGDMPIECQKIIFHLLQLQDLEMGMTEAGMLVPEKSVIAIAGITL
ncbi:MAG: methionine synthase [Bacillota bacterium]|nr:methionine synthase [Bacillota bacterium]